MSKIGILTGGGDCPGLNAVIRAVVKGSLYGYGGKIIGFNNGFKGLVENDAWLIHEEAVSGILPRGGTILGTTNRDNPFRFEIKGEDGRVRYEDCSREAIRHIERWKLEGLIVVGGDGSLALAHRFSMMGVPVIGIPKTIDNDLLATEVTFGFDTAAATATDAIDKIHTTAESHHRAMVVEVMGRNAGWIALQGGMAGGGDIILIPELPFCYEVVTAAIRRRRDRGKKFSIIVVAEGAYPEGGKPCYQEVISGARRLGGIGPAVAREIELRTAMESRATVLGHLQRGGTPSSFDRVLATRFGVEAVKLAHNNRWNRMVCLQAGEITSVPLKKAIAGTKRINPEGRQVKAALAVGTSFGQNL
ncbi:MAG: ATP-dependent 6-phosphofructokinase [Firmicutes bacterium]|nr:ATP-dependent 6-phosphofructokinase [Bacillota bacterium]